MVRPDDRFLGLTRRARRFVIPIVAVALIFVVLGLVKGARGDERDKTAPAVGGDLHAVTALGSRVFVGGHGGAAFRTPSGGWTHIGSLDNKDVMAWAGTGSLVLAGGHAGLYRSTDDGSTFVEAPGLAVSDVHALGAAGDTVYVASPEAGVLVSADNGKTFEQRSSVGRAFMGTIWVDPNNPNIAIAPSMQDGAVKTTDGGKTWGALSSSSGAMAVAVENGGAQILVLGMDSAESSTDGGATWSAVEVPTGSLAAAYTADGRLVVAVLAGNRAEVFEQVGGKWNPLA